MAILLILVGLLSGIVLITVLLAFLVLRRKPAPAPIPSHLPRLPVPLQQRADGMIEVPRKEIPPDILMMASEESEAWARDDLLQQALEAYRVHRSAGHTEDESWQAARLTMADEGNEQ